ncbi:MAG: DUF5693 family protein [Candidatus Eremiobacteraeota bacterium]|nr:DUF5693 family protein [Candidatus Eremiobacteraeota bacterium]
MILAGTRNRLVALILLIALASAAIIGFERLRIEQATRRVELAMDYNDFLSLARSYNYNPEAFLVALRRAGLTSLALSEELGANVNSSRNAYVTSGVALMDSARISAIADPALAALLRARKIVPDEVYLVVYDVPTFARYRRELALRLGASSVHVLHNTPPYVIALRTQLDYFAGMGLGIPDDQMRRVRRLNFLLIPRVQNDERFGERQISSTFGAFGSRLRASSVIFFGLRNQVLGFPDHIPDTADAFRKSRLNYGSIETYDENQVQKGNADLARLIPGQTTRVQAISKLELDKLKGDDIVARYLLGVRERNIRIVYLRPYTHEWHGLSVQKTNIELVSRIAAGLQARGFHLGRATPIPLYRGNNRILVGLCALAVPAMFVLLLAFFGTERFWMTGVAFGATVLLYVAGLLTHHDLLVRSLIALAGAIVFGTAAVCMVAGAFFEVPRANLGSQILRSSRWTIGAILIALAGGLVVVGLMSSPLFMEEIERFRGVKAVLFVPPLIALALYAFTDRFNAKLPDPRGALRSPLRIYQLLLVVILLGLALLVLTRSGNQSEVAPSSIELSLRSNLTSLLSVRPRFKEFLVGFPLLMLLPALWPEHRRWVGWLFVLGIGVGLADVLDTFSHLHTPLVISLVRVIYGAVIGCAIGAVAIVFYRRSFHVAPAKP